MSDVLEAIYRVIQGGDQDEVARLTEKALAGGILCGGMPLLRADVYRSDDS